MEKYKIGDRVSSLQKVILGKVGTVVCVQDDDVPYLVEFDEEIPGGHNGSMSGNVYKANSCSWCKGKDLKYADDIQALFSRIASIEKDLASAREALEKAQEAKKPSKLLYDELKLYIGLKDGTPYILTGYGGQACLDYHIERGFDIHVFDTTREAMQFFLDNLKR